MLFPRALAVARSVPSEGTLATWSYQVKLGTSATSKALAAVAESEMAAAAALISAW